MTDFDYLKALMRVVRDYARVTGVKIDLAQEEAAEVLGHAHWQALMKAVSGGSQPYAEDVARVREVLLGESYSGEGFIGPHPYRLSEDFRETHMTGRGWRIVIGMAPSNKPQLQVTDPSLKGNPILDPDFVAKALPIAEWNARQVRARVKRIWPRRSTMPDKEGRVRHPLFGGLADLWTCCTCGAALSGRQIAENFWHCPDCGTKPLNIELPHSSTDEGEI